MLYNVHVRRVCQIDRCGVRHCGQVRRPLTVVSLCGATWSLMDANGLLLRPWLLLLLISSDSISVGNDRRLLDHADVDERTAGCREGSRNGLTTEKLNRKGTSRITAHDQVGE